MKIGQKNVLRLDRITSSGAFLEDENGNDVLLPGKYLEPEMQEGTMVEVFLYRDSEDRLVATTETPNIQLDGFNYLEVKDVSLYGAFLDWGLEKDLLVPYKEQKSRMEEGKKYLISLRLDESTDRLFGTTKTEKLLEKCPQDQYEIDQEVSLLVCNRTDLGRKVIVDDRFSGLIFNSYIDRELLPGMHISGYIHDIREDGKIDIRLSKTGQEKRDDASEKLLSILKSKGRIDLGDKSNPEDIRRILGMSKKTFKQAVGNLYKQKLIEVAPREISLKAE
ncbi:MAG: hypothetical protein EP333_05370 [Bacteroidetes bacterium]|nr:MAG: hypothetical protein EP333_05370 [Bacteroidota bacterium]TNE98872.1 MAG: hypothetical protein EP322_04145 [Bacteroidota bacterium]